MNSDERELKDFVQQHVPVPTHLEYIAARDRVLNEMRTVPPHLQNARLADRSLAPSEPGRRVEGWQRTAVPSAAVLRTAVPMAAAAAALVIVVGAAMVWPRGVRVYAAGNDGLQVTLADDSSVEMRAHSEMTVGRAADGIQIDLKTGDIIVTAAEQHDGHLYVRTKDMTVAVDGTVFLVNASQDGSRVGVIEGEVRVREGNRETRLRPGEQVATSSTVVSRPLTEDINWSKNASAHRAVLDSKVIPQTAATLAPVAPPGQAAAASSQAAKTEFEEASIRPCDPNNFPPGTRGGGAANTFRMTPARTYGTCLTLATLIRTAFGGGLLDGPPLPLGGRPRIVTEDGRIIYPPDPRDFSGVSAMAFERGYYLGVEDGVRVRGGPDWVRSERYTIEAVATGAADAQTMRGPMLRGLLERRFGLKVHVETEQIPALRLTVAPGGLKMKEAICTKSDTPPAGLSPAAQAAIVRRNREATRVFGGPTGQCELTVAMNGPNLLLVSDGFAGADLGGSLGMLLGSPLVNQTGIPDPARFVFELQFVPDDSLAREYVDRITSGDRQVASDPATVPRAPGIVTALEEQLGLRLERVRAPREFIVIDQVERPGPN